MCDSCWNGFDNINGKRFKVFSDLQWYRLSILKNQLKDWDLRCLSTINYQQLWSMNYKLWSIIKHQEFNFLDENQRIHVDLMRSYAYAFCSDAYAWRSNEIYMSFHLSIFKEIDTNIYLQASSNPSKPLNFEISIEENMKVGFSSFRHLDFSVLK